MFSDPIDSEDKESSKSKLESDEESEWIISSEPDVESAKLESSSPFDELEETMSSEADTQAILNMKIKINESKIDIFLLFKKSPK